MWCTAKVDSNATPSRRSRAAPLSRRPLERASVRCPLNGGSAAGRATRGTVAARTVAASPSTPEAGSWSTRTAVNQAVAGPSWHSTGPLWPAVHSWRARASWLAASSSTSPRKRSVTCQTRAPDETQALGRLELALQRGQPPPRGLVGPSGHEESHLVRSSALAAAVVSRRRRRSRRGLSAGRGRQWIYRGLAGP